MFWFGRTKAKLPFDWVPTVTEVETMDVNESALRETLDKRFGRGGWRMGKRGNKVIVWAPRKLKTLSLPLFLRFSLGEA